MMGRPRESQVPTERGHCPEHGVVEFRLHKRGTRADGSIRYQRRCTECHAEAELARYHQRKGA